MHFLIYPPLWFLRGAPPTVTSADVCVSTLYNVSLSAGEFTSVDLELSAFVYGVSITSEDESEITAGIDLDNESFSGLTAKVSVVPVYVLDQTGMAEVSTSNAYKLSITFATGSIFPDVTPQTTYKVSVDATGSVLIFDNVDVSAAYNVTVSSFAAVQVQGDPGIIVVSTIYQITASSNVVIFNGNAGGLVWSRKKGRYIAVRVGSEI